MAINKGHIRTLRRYLLSQAFAYLVAGIYLITSELMQQEFLLSYFGHLFLATSFIILVSLCRTIWVHKVAVILDTIFSQALFNVIIAGLFIDLIFYTVRSHASSANPNESVPISVFTIICVWLLFYFLVEFKWLRRRRKVRLCVWRYLLPNIGKTFLLLAMLFVVASLLSILTKAFPPTYFLGPSFTFFTLALGFAPWHWE